MTLPKALRNLDFLSPILRADRLGLFSDFDGTLTPIFDDPRDTTLSPAIRDILSDLSEKLEIVAVVSGRDAKFLRETIGLNSLTYVGNHGLEVWKAGAERPELGARVPEGVLEDVHNRIEDIAIPGLYLENKGLSVAVHYRNAADPASARSALTRTLKRLADAHALDIREGKMVLEIGPGAGVNKGAAVERLAREFRLTGAIVLGDDVTDCDAFDALHRLIRERGLRGAAVAVVDAETPELVLRKADYRLSGMAEVEEFLRRMAYDSPKAAMKP